METIYSNINKDQTPDELETLDLLKEFILLSERMGKYKDYDKCFCVTEAVPQLDCFYLEAKDNWKIFVAFKDFIFVCKKDMSIKDQLIWHNLKTEDVICIYAVEIIEDKKKLEFTRIDF